MDPIRGSHLGRRPSMPPYVGRTHASRRLIAHLPKQNSCTAEAIHTCKLNDVDPRVWLADVLMRLPDHPAKRIQELLPWNWSPKIAAAQEA